MANSNEYYLRSKGGLVGAKEETQETKEEHSKDDSTGSVSDPEDYTVDYTRIHALRTGIANLGINLIDLVNSNVNNKNNEKIANIEYALEDSKILLAELVKNAQEVETARTSRERKHTPRMERQEETHQSTRDAGLVDDKPIEKQNEERRFLDYLGPNVDHIVKPDKEDTYRDDEYVEQRLNDRPILPKWDELDHDRIENNLRTYNMPIKNEEGGLTTPVATTDTVGRQEAVIPDTLGGNISPIMTVPEREAFFRWDETPTGIPTTFASGPKPLDFNGSSGADRITEKKVIIPKLWAGMSHSIAFGPNTEPTQQPIRIKSRRSDNRTMAPTVNSETKWRAGHSIPLCSTDNWQHTPRDVQVNTNPFTPNYQTTNRPEHSMDHHGNGHSHADINTAREWINSALPAEGRQQMREGADQGAADTALRQHAEAQIRDNLEASQCVSGESILKHKCHPHNAFTPAFTNYQNSQHGNPNQTLSFTNYCDAARQRDTSEGGRGVQPNDTGLGDLNINQERNNTGRPGGQTGGGDNISPLMMVACGNAGGNPGGNPSDSGGPSGPSTPRGNPNTDTEEQEAIKLAILVEKIKDQLNIKTNVDADRGNLLDARRRAQRGLKPSEVLPRKFNGSDVEKTGSHLKAFKAFAQIHGYDQDND